MMSWQAWRPPAGWPANAPSVRWQRLPLPLPDDAQGTGHEASLWLFALDDPAFDIPSLTACLNDEEQSRASRFRQALHGRRHRVAHAMVRHLIGHIVGQPAADLVWRTGAHGKPHLVAAGDSARPLHVNLSHSGGWALLATSFTLEVGIDIEEGGSRQHLGEMAPRILSPEELAALPREPDLLRAWTRKEACLKALGTGLMREMDTLTLTEGPARTSDASLSTHGPLPPLGWSDLTLPENCPGRAACAWLMPG